MATLLRKRNRLHLDSYRLGYACSITSNTRDRRPLFRNLDVGARVVEYLEEAANHFGIGVLAYCVMPDHIHLLVHAPAAVSVIDFLKRFKQMSGYHLKQQLGVDIWQKSSHDHIARRDEDIIALAQYIFHNPVRAGIVGCPGGYPLSGSFVWGRSAVVEG